MKKILALLGSISLIASGASTTMAMSPARNTKKLNSTENNQNLLKPDNEEILNQNLNILENIDEELVLNSLSQQGNNVLINYQVFTNLNLTVDFIELIKDFKLTDINIQDASQLLFTKNASFSLNLDNLEAPTFGLSASGQIHLEAPRVWYEWIGGVWRLQLDHTLTQNIYYGFMTTSIILNIINAINPPFGMLNKIAVIIVNKLLTEVANALKNADQGNGTLIRFAAWVIPTKYAPSSRNW